MNKPQIKKTQLLNSQLNPFIILPSKSIQELNILLNEALETKKEYTQIELQEAEGEAEGHAFYFDHGMYVELMEHDAYIRDLHIELVRREMNMEQKADADLEELYKTTKAEIELMKTNELCANLYSTGDASFKKGYTEHLNHLHFVCDAINLEIERRLYFA